MTDKPVLTYFDIEGLGECIRLAFTLNEVDFEDVRVDFKSEWPALKEKTPYGQLPTLKVGDKTFAQSLAILMWAGKQGNGKAYPQEDMKKFEIDQALMLIEDFAKAWTPAAYLPMRPSKFGYPDDFAETKEGKETIKALREKFVEEQIPLFCEKFVSMIKESGGFLCSSDEPTIADFHLLPKIRNFQRGILDHVPTTCLDKFEDINAYRDRVMSHPKIKEWYAAHPDKNANA